MANVILENVSRVFRGGRISRENGSPSGRRAGASDVVAVCDLCLEVKDRELLVLLGPSGCGKSTTLRLIAGLERPNEGRIHIGNRMVNDVAPKDRDIAMVFQDGALYPHMSVRANMAFGLKLRSGESLLWRALVTIGWKIFWPRKAAELTEKQRLIEKQVGDAAKILEIEHLLDRVPSELSGGERQRVALGRTIVRRPAVFLFDEPLSSLDARLRGGMRRELKELHRRLQTTMIYVTHDQVEAMTLGERIVVMNEGRIQQIGPPKEIYDRPINRFVAGFIGKVPMNFLEGQLERATTDSSNMSRSNENTNRKDHERADDLIFRLADVCLPVTDRIAEELRPFEGKAIVLGIRPEDVIRLPDGQSDDRLARVRAAAADVEHLGDVTVIHWDLGAYEGGGQSGRRILVQGKSETRELRKSRSVSIEKTTTVGFDMSRAHWFDPASGNHVALAQPSEIGRK